MTDSRLWTKQAIPGFYLGFRETHLTFLNIFWSLVTAWVLARQNKEVKDFWLASEKLLRFSSSYNEVIRILWICKNVADKVEHAGAQETCK